MKFKLEIWEETGGYVTVEADTEAKAREHAQECLDRDGFRGFPDHEHVKITHGDREVLGAEQIK